MNPDHGVRAGGRPMSSCIECQRRKQKCNRQWPCNHCQERKVAHLCHFKSTEPAPNYELSSNSERIAPKKRNIGDIEDDEGREEEPVGLETPFSDPTMSIRSLGYLDAEDRPELFEKGDKQANSSTATTDCTQFPEEFKETLRVIPPRPYTDVIVHHALNRIDYVYTTLYPQVFLEEYERWWSSQSLVRSAAFACLLLRVCAISTQYLSPSLSHKLESELGESVQSLTERYHNAARQLSSQIDPGAGGLGQAQQLFLTAVWYKGEGLFARAWHSLGEAVREAQEIGIHKESMRSHLTDFERELGRRVWCGIYTWDRFMSVILGRPFLVSDRDCTVRLPSTKLDHDLADCDIPSPIVTRILERQLAGYSVEISERNGTPDLVSICRLKSKLQDWVDGLPPAFHISDPDKRWDEKYERLKFERLRLHLATHMTFFMLLKPLLLAMYLPTPAEIETNIVSNHRLAAVDCSIDVIRTCRLMVDLFIPEKAKYYMIPFGPFDTAATLCAALQRDQESYSLPRREEIIRTTGEALGILREMKPLSKVAESGHRVLNQLVSSIGLRPTEKSLLVASSCAANKRATLAKDSLLSTVPQTSSVGPSNLGVGNLTLSTLNNHESDSFLTDFLSVDPDNRNEYPLTASMGNGRESWPDGLSSIPSDLDLGVLDGLFDWSAFFSQPMPS